MASLTELFRLLNLESDEEEHNKSNLQYLARQHGIDKLATPDSYAEARAKKVFREETNDVEREIRGLAVALTLYELSTNTVRRIAGDLLTDNGVIRLDNAGAQEKVPSCYFFWIVKAVVEVADRNSWNMVERAFARFAAGYFDFQQHFRRKVRGGEKHFAKAREHALEVEQFPRSLRLAFARMAWYWNGKGRDRKQAEVDAETGINKAEESNCRYVGWCYVELAAARLTLGRVLIEDVETLLEKARERLTSEPGPKKSIMTRRLQEQEKRISNLQGKDKEKSV